MQPDLSARPYIEILILAEEAIKGGASPAYTMKHLCDRGALPASAEQAVLEATKNVQAKRQYEQDLRKEENNEGYKWGLLFIALAIPFFVAGILLDLSATRGVAYLFVCIGLKKLRSTWLNNNNYC